ncbi:UPF0029 domain-containing protein [Aphelenchoides besseyi]|nr:UPF0029 domain-containing protein [Aphelenchoides besseyi]KAI6210100.1 UPF0029 domain-containing protein [Aphelenchoides besseyi]
MSSVAARPLETEWMTADRLVEHLQPGDLIEIRRVAQLQYAHWAIYLGEDQGVPEVIHFATAFGDFGPQMEMLSAQMQNGNQNYLESLLSNPMAHIRLDSLHDVVGGSIARINHSLDKKHPPFPSEVIIERALSKLDTHGYHLISNNCEHFVNWCRYDQPISQQVDSHVGMLNSFMRHLTHQFTSTRTMETRTADHRMICHWIEDCIRSTDLQMAIKRNVPEKRNPKKVANKEIERKSFEWFSGQSIQDRKSTFQAHVIEIASKEEAIAALDKLKECSKISRAKHNIFAYVLIQSGASISDSDDDGEKGAAAKLLHLIETMHVENMLVVVTRWFGGPQIGADRFHHILNAARQVIVEYRANKISESKR